MAEVLRVVENLDDLVKAFVVRGIVFAGEQGISYNLDRDGCDTGAVHVLSELDGEPVAAGRIRFLDGFAKLERIAVRKPYRGRHLGRRLTEFMIAVARKRGFSTCKLHAQAYLEKYYEAHGFKTKGPRFVEAGIEHCLMIRDDASAGGKTKGVRH
ncbi:MAG: GNAT family N-acetyltransferase [Planctomycetota bacterium]|nr:GNAT family N-acetyltransferase [Planctomycetota bacterium]